MTKVNGYLTFNGNCKQAFDFTKSILASQYPYAVTFGEMPPVEGAPAIPDEMKDGIMHISLPISKETSLVGSDTGGDWGKDFKEGNNFSISVNTQDQKEAERIFTALSKNGNIIMPLGVTFWQSYYGMLTDQFGINWMTN